MATKVIRKKNGGLTLIISPLLALMNNQIDAAAKLNLNVRTIYLENSSDWNTIYGEINHDEVDALIVAPERLADDDFQNIMLSAHIGLFVVDEAHCISDWGHDFRPDYRRIIDIVNRMPSNIPVLATTATANNRVVEDIKKQLGDELIISRGSLMRDSLSIQIIKLASKEERLAWMTKNINKLPGVGIVYCLTINDCELVNKWLNSQGISCECYHSKLTSDEKNAAAEKFLKNQIKVLAATVALGMGFDKPDIAFVIHFQKPGNVISYYQQIGRAGRNIETAYAILFCGSEDDEINQYFIDSAFPTEREMNDIVDAISNHSGISQGQLEQYVNMHTGRLKKCLKYLTVKGDIYIEYKNKREKKGIQYYKKAQAWQPDLERSNKIIQIRINELQQMNDFINTSECYMKFIANALDDPDAKECGRCANCLKMFNSNIPLNSIAAAQDFLKKDFHIIAPRQKWPISVRLQESNNILPEYKCEEGRVLSNYGDAGWGKHIADCKYRLGHFDAELIEASVRILTDFVAENNIKWVTNIPSRRRPELVRDFAQELARRLGLEYRSAIIKTQNALPQKELNTSYRQYENANNSFVVIETLPENVLLIDDMVDSRWTMTVCGYKLREKGSGKVYPFALANSAGREENNSL